MLASRYRRHYIAMMTMPNTGLSARDFVASSKQRMPTASFMPQRDAVRDAFKYLHRPFYLHLRRAPAMHAAECLPRRGATILAADAT